MDALTGTLRLLRLSLRLDRIKLPIWIGVTVGLVALTLPQLQAAYSSQSQRILYASTTSSSPVSRLLGGALTGPSMGEITVVETFVMIVILVCLMNIFLVTRHTRQNEESGRSELIGSTPVGRQAPLTATLILAFAANIVAGLLLYIVYTANGFGASDSAAYSIGIAAAGFMFAGIAAITAQLFENTRAANGLAGLILGLSFLIRGVADTLGELRPDGLGVITSNLSWLSPLGWVTNMKPFANLQWWVLGLFALSSVMLIAIAYGLLSRRDVGFGLIAARAGKRNASNFLLSRFGLIWRLNRTSFISWLLALMAMGATLGGVANEFGELIDGNEEMQKLLASIGGSKDPSDIMFSATFTIIGITVAGYALQVLTRMKSEENSGRLEVVMATPLSRLMWLIKYIIFTLGASLLILALTGASAGIVYGIIVGNLGEVGRLTVSILVHFPAIAVLTGVAVTLFGLFTRLFNAIVWTTLAACLLIFQLGALLKLPQTLLNLSPFTHTPPSPADSLSLTPLIIQILVAFCLLALGAVLFKKRDLATD